ncbi:MAG: hypothetical protein GF334_06525 [Candidatus Altiarchaeales archaeon]|nr:hypothetical protein [Candidatus Altiarchaeales archaeon]
MAKCCSCNEDEFDAGYAFQYCDRCGYAVCINCAEPPEKKEGICLCPDCDMEVYDRPQEDI